MIIYDFKCPDGHVFERLVKSGESVYCDCGKEAKKIISPVRSMLDPISGHFPGATMKWARDRPKKIAQERKNEQ